MSVEIRNILLCGCGAVVEFEKAVTVLSPDGDGLKLCCSRACSLWGKPVDQHDLDRMIDEGGRE